MKQLPIPQMKTKFDVFQSHDFGGGYTTLNIDTDVKQNQLTGGQNVDVNGNSIEKRKGHLLYGSIPGFTTQNLGLITHYPSGGTQEFLTVYDTTVMRYVSGTWTALTSVTMTTNLPVDWAYFSFNKKTYIVNGTDNVVKYSSSTSGDQTDGSFKKGKYICQYQNRLIVAGISGQEEYIWYSDLAADTFGANNYFKSNYGAVTGVRVIFDKLLVFTANNVEVVSNFNFNGAATQPTSFLPMRGTIGCIAYRTWQIVGNIGYFLALNSDGLVAVYNTDGSTIGNAPVSLPIYGDMQNIDATLATNACAGIWGRYYRISLPQNGQSLNNLEYTYDTVQKRWSPPYTNTVGGFSSYVNYTINGAQYLFAGSQSDGRVYQLSQRDYDENIYTSYTVLGSVDTPIDANPAKRASRRFTASGQNFNSQTITKYSIRLKKNTGTTTDLQVRIETDVNGLPSGNLVNANAVATITAFTSTTYTYYTGSFTAPFMLTGGTAYHLVIKHVTELAGNSQYYWSGVGSLGSAGHLTTYTSTTSSTSSNFNSGGVTAMDGYLAAQDNTFSFSFANSRAATSATSIDQTSTTMSIEFTSDSSATLSRGFLLFDTSSIPVGATITAATLSLYPTFVQLKSGSQSFNIVSFSPAGNTTAVNADYNISNFGSTRFITDYSLASITTGTYTNLTLNASGIAGITKAGITKFGIRLSGDIDNSKPTSIGDIDVDFATSKSTIPSSKPVLSITYSVASGVYTWSSDTTTDQDFALLGEGDIDGYADTAALYISPIGQKFHLRDLFIDTEASGNYPMQVGINTGDYTSFNYQDFSLASAAYLIGQTYDIGVDPLGQTLRSEQRIRWDAIRGYTLKIRFRNRFANQPFKIYGIRTRHEVLPKIK